MDSMKKKIAYLLLLLMLIPVGSFAKEKRTFEIKDGHFYVNGKVTPILSGEMHYPRIPHQYWRHRLRMMRAMGLNTVATYVFWNLHETEPGKWDFEGDKNLAEYIRIAGEEGLMVILRPGPYVCAEWEFGGYPWWLQNIPGMEIRRDNPEFLKRTKLYIDKLYEQVGDLQVSKGGPIIMVQAENEFGSYVAQRKDIPLEEHRRYNAKIKRQLADAGFNVPLFTSDGSWLFEGGSTPGALPTANGESNVENLKKVVNEYHGGVGPYMVAEFYPGWLMHWAEPFPDINDSGIARQTETYLQNDVSFNFYMVHGGTNFGFTSGANYDKKHDIQPDLTSYDYDAPISEAGWATPKYYKLRELLTQYADSGQVIPDVPAAYPLIEIPAFTVGEVAPLFDNLPAPQASKEIKPMEQFDQGWGTILYRTTLPAVKEGTTLLIDEVHDWAQVFADGKLLGRLDRRRGENTVVLPALAAGTRLDILVEAMGRVNFDVAIHDRKGITDKVELISDTGRQELEDWQVYSFPVDYAFVQDKKYAAGDKLDGPAYYRTTFELDEVGDVFLDMQTWGKGMVWVNGKAMGRFWEIGPQQTLFMPGCWLKKGKNEIIILDLLGPEKAVVEGRKEPILDMLRAEAPATHREEGQTLNLKGEKPVANGALKPGNGWQEVKFGQTVKGRYFCLEALDAQDGKDNAAMAEFYLLDEDGKPLPRQHWNISYADSESTQWGNFTADKIYDLQESTYWSTKQGDKYPHQVVIDLKEEQTISGFRYLPRAEEGFPGMIKGYKAYVKATPFAM